VPQPTTCVHGPAALRTAARTLRLQCAKHSTATVMMAPRMAMGKRADGIDDGLGRRQPSAMSTIPSLVLAPSVRS
jgi:hypothetical protein